MTPPFNKVRFTLEHALRACHLSMSIQPQMRCASRTSPPPARKLSDGIDAFYA